MADQTKINVSHLVYQEMYVQGVPEKTSVREKLITAITGVFGAPRTSVKLD